MHSSLLPLCRTHQRARSGAQIRRVRSPRQDNGWHTIKGRVYLIRKGHRDPETRKCSHGKLKQNVFSTLFMFAVTPHSGDRSMAATWLRELQGSRTAGPCQSSTLWRATWARGDERPHLSSTRMKRSAPSPHSQCTFNPLLIFVSGDKNKWKTNCFLTLKSCQQDV